MDTRKHKASTRVTPIQSAVLPLDDLSRFKRITYADDFLLPEVRPGDALILEYGLDPLPSDIVLCRSKNLGLEFIGRFILRMEGSGGYIEINVPGFEREVDASHVDVLAVLVSQIRPRQGRPFRLSAVS